ncbi:hypothetical protein CDD82_6411 [Ophiocordyceps australis]|uniref:Major facilitator superfamily (MFS) profile domain-containing protein n=1 Tax=Ophiocordyceps australis TaxID=1399860 RepID=A0A2C5ZR57_9HYPO|nr:hypothetical protein CDD82_6411 [Ophiocordyceps australis]
MTDQELQDDVRLFVDNHLPIVEYQDLLRAARVAKDVRLYDEVARHEELETRHSLPVTLTRIEKTALRREQDVAFSEKGMLVVIATVSVAALLQGMVQSSFNSASLYAALWGLDNTRHTETSNNDDWRLGAANASPWFFAALLGCPLSLPINYWYGRRGAITFAAFLILVSSIGAIFVKSWTQLFCVRIINGLGSCISGHLGLGYPEWELTDVSGMGIKAVSTTILASETAVGFWRGSAILAWQLWVAFGIMMGFSLNLIFTLAESDRITFGLIQGAPMVPSLALLIMAVGFCPESPRYHLLKGPNYSVRKAYKTLQQVRNTEVRLLDA